MSASAVRTTRAWWGLGPGAWQRVGAPLACEACLMSIRPYPPPPPLTPRPWPAGADPALPGHGPVLGVAGGRLFPPDRRLEPLLVPRGGSTTASDEHPGRYPRTSAVSAGGGHAGDGGRGGGRQPDCQLQVWGGVNAVCAPVYVCSRLGARSC